MNKIIKKVAHAIELAESNSDTKFDWDNLAQAAINALGVTILPTDAKLKYNDIIMIAGGCNPMWVEIDRTTGKPYVDRHWGERDYLENSVYTILRRDMRPVIQGNQHD